jgi:hypothetical protein
MYIVYFCFIETVLHSFGACGGNRSFGENYRLFASPMQTLYWEHLSWAGFQLTTVIGIGTDCIVSCKSNYHSITTAPKLFNTVSIKTKAYNIRCELKSRSRKVFSIQRLQGTCDKSVVFSETPVSSTNKTEILFDIWYGHISPLMSHVSPSMIYARVTLVH